MNTQIDLFAELVKTNFKLRYRGSVLGFIWVLMKPFLIFVLLYIVFSKLGQNDDQLSKAGYGVYLLLGLIVFNFISEGVIWGMNSLLDRESIILKVNFNRVIAVLSSVALAVINFLINLGIVGVVAIFAGVSLSPIALLYFMLVSVTILLAIVALAFFSSIALIRLRDLTHITELLMQLLFYGSAIFYPASFIPERWQFILRYNPIAVLIDTSRRAVLFGEIANIYEIVLLFGVSFTFFIVGWVFFNQRVKKVAEFF